MGFVFLERSLAGMEAETIYTEDNYDINSVGVPITGLAAFAPVSQESVIEDAQMGAKKISFPSGYKKLGLYKKDGGPAEEREDGDAIELFQEGYVLAGDSKLRIKISLAEDNSAVNHMIDGKTPDENGVVYVDQSLPDAQWILFVATRFKNGKELRRHGVVRVYAVEVDQESRGEVRGKTVTLEWVPSPLFAGKPYKKWLGIPGGVTVTMAPKTASVKAGQTVTLTATVVPSGQQIQWSSADSETAQVSQLGVVTGVKQGGPVTITAKVGAVSDTCAVTVTA